MSRMLAKEIKPGSVLTYQENPVLIESMTVQSPSARGAATLYKFRGRNLITKQKIDIVLKGTDNVPEADFQKRAVKMMYKDTDQLHLLDQEDYNQYSLPISDCEEQLNFLTESLEGVLALVFQMSVLGCSCLPASNSPLPSVIRLSEEIRLRLAPSLPSLRPVFKFTFRSI